MKMNILQLLFDRETGQDTLGKHRVLHLDDEIVARLSDRHFISSVEVLEPSCERSGTGCESVDSTLYIRMVDGWLSLEAAWMKPLRLCPAENVDEVHEAAQLLRRRMAALSRWRYELHECSFGSLEVDKLLALAQQFSGFAMVLFDASFNLTGYALGDTLLTQAFQETIKLGYAAGVSEEHQRRYRQYLDERLGGFETVLEEPERSTSVWVLPFQTCHAKTYFLHIMLGRERYRGLRSLADALVDELRAMLERRESMRDRAAASNFVVDLATTELSEQRARQRADFLGWRPVDSYLMIRIESFGVSHPDTQLEVVCENVKQVLSGIHAAVVDHGIAGLVEEGDGNRLGSVLFSSQMEELLLSEGMRMVVSGSIHRLSAVAKVHCDLREALAVLWRASKRGLPTFSRCAIPYDECKYLLLADALHRVADEHDVVPDFLARIRLYDAMHDAEFERTLTSFVGSMKSKVETCAVLNIHRSTLEYRLERLHNYFGVDLDDEATLACIQMLALAL